ncbi:hypothetical protein JHK85_004765 [Glycine max]|nr:hypothetical protein JHK85_004765 [Glycine max]
MPIGLRSIHLTSSSVTTEICQLQLLSPNVRCVWFLRFEVMDLIASTAKLDSLSFM